MKNLTCLFRNCLMLSALLLTLNLGAQKDIHKSSQGCVLEIDSETFDSYLKHKELNLTKYENARSSAPFTVPVRVIGLRRSDGTGLYAPNNATRALEIIDLLNQGFTNTNVTFEHCGDPIFIDSDYFYQKYQANDLNFDNYTNSILLELAYFSSDANVYSPSPGVNGNSATWACLASNGTGDANDIYGCQFTEIDNLIRLNSFGNLSTITHEFGHHLGLLHPFNGAFNYNNVLLSSPIDYFDNPYNRTLNSRELIIRDIDNAKLYSDPNCSYAQDFCCDTPATGRPNNGSDMASIKRRARYPAPTNINCCAVGDPDFDITCCNNVDPGIYQTSVADGCVLSGPYRDYNGDIYESQTDLQTIATNYMSYSYFNDCGNYSFTGDQINRFFVIHDARRVDQYELDKCGNHKDVVHFWDGPEIINETSIQNRHPVTDKYSNTFTDFEGNFSSILYENVLTSKVRKLGSEGLDNYTSQDWREGLDITDVVQLLRGIVLLDPLNGYQKLSGDVSNNGIITITDVVIMQRLLLMLEDNYANHSAPWKFIPEYIPTENFTEFHADPFNMTIDGVPTNGLPIYADESWEYEVLDGNSGSSGFHGYKLGDLNKSSGLVPPNCYSAEIEVADQIIPSNQTIDIGISIKNNVDLEGIQLDLIFDPRVVIEEVSSVYQSFSSENNYNILETAESKQFHMIWYDVYGKSTSPSLNEFTISVSIPESMPLENMLGVEEENPAIIILNYNDCNTVADMEISAEIGGGELMQRQIDNQVEISRDILVYPNPSAGIFEVRILNKKSGDKIAIEISSISGKKVMEMETYSDRLILDSNEFPAGLYQLKVNFGGKMHFEKIIFN